MFATYSCPVAPLPRVLRFLISPNRGLLLLVVLIGILLLLVFNAEVALMWISAALFVLLVAFILVSAVLPPPKPFRESRILTKFIYQILLTTWKGLMVGVAAYLGALVSIEIQQASSKPENTLEAFATSITGTLPLVLTIALTGGLLTFLLAASFDVHRTPRGVKRQAMAAAASKARGVFGRGRASGISENSLAIQWWDAATSGLCLAATAFLTAPVFLFTSLYRMDIFS